MRIGAIIAMLLVFAATQTAADPENLAAGKPVRFLPPPNYALTAKGETDALDLTDGALCARPDNHLWFDAKSVGFSYAGLQQLSLDLGAEVPIGEVAIRLQGGSPQPGISFPVWVDLVASTDGKEYRRVASFSRWNEGDRERFGVPAEEGKGWVHRLTFGDLRLRARYIGLSLYGAGLMVSDELWVLRGPEDSAPPSGPPVPFCTEGAQLYFHKPVVFFSTNIATPNPVGFLCSLPKDTPIKVALDLPPGVRLVAGTLGGVPVAEVKPEAIPGGGTRYLFSTQAGESGKTWGRLYLTGDWRDGQEGELRYRISWEGDQAPEGKQRLRAVRIQPAPQPKQLLTGLGWWSLAETRAWPEAAEAFRTLGFTYVPVFPRWVGDETLWAFLEELRGQGFQVVAIDSPIHVMLNQNKGNPDLMCQLPDGPGKKFCPSYRGPAYQEEVARLAREAARAKPNLFAADIEVWGWAGPLDAPKCRRCQADFAASGLKEWKEWQVERGIAIWKDLMGAVREASKAAGGPIPLCGGYDFQPGAPYQGVWSVDRLYPEWMHGSQVSTYTPLEPYHLAMVGDEARKDFEALKGSRVIPWLTPGDAGVFPGGAFRDALLECFANGASGLLFWSSRVWDTESLAAYADAIRIVAPVEEIITGGELLAGAKAEPSVRLSGMRRGDRVFLLAADYAGKVKDPVAITLPVTRPSAVIDLETGARIGQLVPQKPSFTVRFERPGARAFHILPE
ncbi:MAG: hypothetical protein GX785_04970 [Armatimonadetes bacterium]|nr:hypothetical protein [Armatimonadota bacterium]